MAVSVRVSVLIIILVIAIPALNTATTAGPLDDKGKKI